ncbi:MAG: peptidoglycan DD-metalloendopeptidase family protein [Crocinitomicaceae bacterium]|nr:peptidoglycan DD-metalloendopeptidase family protein [Crocinitomicaceae bacterium]
MRNTGKTYLLRERIQVIDPKITHKDFMHLDLSKHNPELEKVDITSPSQMELHIQSLLKESNKKAAIGGYLEERNLYKRSEYFTNSDQEDRTIHLGVDIWTGAGTSVLAAYDGRIHSFNYNQNFGDYGPTIILEHEINQQIFFSLYGHLNLESLNNIEVGQPVIQQQEIGWLGTSDVNGNYAPHLHFQLIWDLQGMEGDYPGVCTKSEMEFYKMNCPDPMKILI